DVVDAGAVATNWQILVDNVVSLSIITVLFCILSHTVWYYFPRLLGVRRAQSIASGFEIGIHNSTLAIVIAQTVFGSLDYALPAAVYGVLMFFVAAAFGFVVLGRVAAKDEAEAEAVAAS